MNTSKLKTYAPQARRDFIAAVTSRAAVVGLGPNETLPITEQGEVALIGGTAFLKPVAQKRRALERRIKQEGFDQVMEALAYTWFNRLVAIRYMELHGYLDHGYRVLSHPSGSATPEILEHAAHVDLPGLSKTEVLDLKLDATKEPELYRRLLVAQCNALHAAMPFLFERVEDETELVLPENLLHSDSLVRALVQEIPEESWQEIEIVGWLFQFYISEKKDQVIGKVVKSEDIPAATQLFTPNWIVKYMVQNSLGAQWLATYPSSALRAQMEYYIEPAEQTDEVKAQLAAITPSTLNPEEMTLVDLACGSGHILVEAYDLFKAIYLERGYSLRDVPKLILEKNLYGLDIDQRAAQLSGFALMMKGRADDRRLFERGVKLNVMALVDSAGFDVEKLAEGVQLADYGLQASDLTELKRLFEHATTFGSLIQVPGALAEKLPALKQLREATNQDLFVYEALKRLGPLVQQAELLAAQYDAVVANPPYMSSKYQSPRLKRFTQDQYPTSKSDLFASFIERGYTLAKDLGHDAMVTMQSWMFLSSFQAMREQMLREKTVRTMAHLGARAFGSISGEVVQTSACVLQNRPPRGYRPVFFRLLEGGEDEKRIALAHRNMRFDSNSQDEFKKIPGSPIAYWMSDGAKQAFAVGTPLGEISSPRKGNSTSDNNRFLRYWPEVCHATVGLNLPAHDAMYRWIPYNKGGGFLKWYGHNSYLIDWQDQGYAIRQIPTAVIANESLFFTPGLTWGTVTVGTFSIRWFDNGFIFDNGGCCIFGAPTLRHYLLALLNSAVFPVVIGSINPTVNFQSGEISKFPVIESDQIKAEVNANAKALLASARKDWDAYERSWDFQSLPLLTASSDPTPTLESSYAAWTTQNRDTIAEMKRLEEENNRLFIDAYGLQDELTPEVPVEQITLTVNPAYRYGGNLTEDEQWTRFRQDTMQELVSYAVGCMMGRYSLNEPGLIYAHSGNAGFDPARYTTFPADDDGIIPLTEFPWFEDDAANRLVRFISVAWDASHLEENFTFLADNLSPGKNESSRETIRRYLCTSFFKFHLQTYKRRPIYWLFSSGKQRAFQCLVYLHRYNEGTLARMRTEYVIPLQGFIASRIEHLEGDIVAASSTAHRRKLEKERETLVKHQTELQTFDEKLRHFADKRISLNLDDGVKVNYARFSDLLAEVKAVTGGTDD